MATIESTKTFGDIEERINSIMERIEPLNETAFSLEQTFSKICVLPPEEICEPDAVDSFSLNIKDKLDYINKKYADIQERINSIAVAFNKVI